MGRIIAIANVKGGVGKTTTTANLAAALSERGRQVLAVDLDPQASLTLSLGCQVTASDKTISDALALTAAPASSLIVETNEKYKLIPATHELYDIERELQNGQLRILALDAALEPLRAAYDYILVDCPANAGILTGNALAAADQVVIPFPADFLAYQALGWFLDVTRNVQKKVNPSLRIAGLFIAMYDPRHRHVRDIMNEVKQSFGIDLPFFTAAAKSSVLVKQAALAGQTVLRFAPTSPVAEAYRLLALEIEQGISAAQSDDAFVEIRRGREALAQQDRETAYVAFHKATVLAPDIAEAWIGRSQSAREWDERVRSLAQAHVLKPELDSIQQNLQVCLNGDLHDQNVAAVPNLMGVAHFLAQSNLQLYANRVYARVTELDAQHQEAWLGRAETAASLQEKVESLQRALEFTPGNADIQRALALARERLKAQVFVQVEDAERIARNGATQEAHAMFEEATRLDPQNDRAWLGLARTTDDSQVTLEYIQRALQINPRNAEAAQLYGWLFQPEPPRFQFTLRLGLSILVALALILLLAFYLTRMIH